MKPESRYNPLLDNGSLKHVSMEIRIRGDGLGTERAFHVNGIKRGSHGYAQAINIFYVYAQATKVFHGYRWTINAEMQSRQ
jgi:hypothetical protein